MFQKPQQNHILTVSQQKQHMRISKLYRSSFFYRYLNSLFGVSYDSKGEQSLTVVLVISSFLLTIASGYTTIVGLFEYVPVIIGWILGIGIQGLLFATAWRIGVSIVSQNMKLSLLLIFLFTMFTSVFFSYTALLDVIYKPEYRENDEITNSIDKFSVLMNETQLAIDNYYSNHIDTVFYEINDWNDTIIQIYAGSMSKNLGLLNKRKSTYNKLSNKFDNEVKLGITKTSKNNNSYSPPGYGIYAKRYKNEMDNYYYDSLQTLDFQIKIADSLFNNFSTSIVDLTKSSSYLRYENYALVQSKLKILTSYIKRNFDNQPTFPKLSSKGKSLLNKISEINIFYDWLKKHSITTVPSQKDNLRNYGLTVVSKLPSRFQGFSDKLTKQSISIGKYGGKDVHHFVLSYSALFLTKSPLALSAILLALLIDSLILISGILGARPDSFLNMKTDELFDAQERALEVILALNIEDENKYDNQFIKRIIQIFIITKPDINAAKNGTPGIIQKADIEKYNLTKELGVFISLKLAATNKYNPDVIGLSTRLVLWLAEQVILYENKQGTYTDFKKLLEDL